MNDTIAHGEEAVNELFHFGVKGMRWGVRKGDHPGASRSVNREAASDAKEYARAKMFYGEGAGTRRKLINAKVKTKSNTIPGYKEAFDHHLSKQDFGKHADKARSERKRKDVRKSTSKTARGVHRELSGGFGSTSLPSKLIAEGFKLATKHSDISEDDSMTADNISHGEEAVNEMFHYGVKGMKWGVRNADSSSTPTVKREKQMRVMNAKDVTVTQRKPGRFVKTRGGQRQKASEDAVRAHAGRQKAKKSTTDALSNNELRTAIERMRLEQEFAKLDSKVKRRGETFISRLFQSKQARATTADLAKKVAKTAATAAATA